MALLMGIGLCLSLVRELQTSDIQSWLFARWAAKLEFTVEPGPSSRIAFPQAGPFDERRGYTRLPQFTESLRADGFNIREQARQTPELARLIKQGIAPPYREEPLAGLTLRDAADAVLFDATADARVFHSFDEIPTLIVQTLLFIENRNIGDDAGPRANPALDWKRSGKAIFSYAGRKLGVKLSLEGGSTLATQLQKFRHSPGGRTASPGEKIRQMVGASLAAYRNGRETGDAREQIIMDYLNTMPLSAAPGVGEINGLGEGLRAWFGMDLEAVCTTLGQAEPSIEKALAYRHALALLYAVHAPTHFLVTDRRELEHRLDGYSELLHSAGVIDDRLFALVKGMPLEFAVPPAQSQPRFVDRKALNAVRVEVAERLHVRDLADLDGLDLEVESTIDGTLQQQVTGTLQELASPDFVAANGLRGPHLLSRGDPRLVTYSFLLLESRAEGNLVRVRTDTLDAPFDVNNGVKLELGSTAKLRTIAHYLGVMTDLYQDLSILDASRLEQRVESARDPLTRWAAGTLRAQPGVDVDSFLLQALDRRYSASPAEVFFTGGGVHRFRNFEPSDNGRVLTVRDALIHSTNLVFIRLMRDLVRFHQARLPYQAAAVLGRSDDPVRRLMLTDIANEETRRSLARAYVAYRDLPLSGILQRLLKTHTASPRALAIVFYAWHQDVTSDGGPHFAHTRVDTNTLQEWLRRQLPGISGAEVQRLERAYGNPRLTLADFAYLLRADPLALWCAGELARDPHVSWDELLVRSESARTIASAWLFKTRNRNAQDLRLRIRIERDAFARMLPFWRALGFPFATLVPSYATAIGSSADRPAALAELMGVIVNHGRRLPAVDIRHLSFGVGTPFQTVFEKFAGRGDQVMSPAVARLLREVLAEVVERGTARRLDHAFVTGGGEPIPVGGKTGSGDNRFETFARSGRMVSAQAVNRTASFVFYLGDRWFGVITASVNGPQAATYSFTSSLPLAVLKLLSPTLTRALYPATKVRQSAGTGGLAHRGRSTQSYRLPSRPIRPVFAVAPCRSSRGSSICATP